MNKAGETLVHVAANKLIICAIISEEAGFIVVGGLAVSWYCSDRQADDMDLLFNPTLENPERISSTPCELHLLGCSSDSITKYRLRAPLKQIYQAGLLTPHKDEPAYQEVENESVVAKLFDMPVRSASPASHIRMKERAINSEPDSGQNHKEDIERLGKFAV